MANALGVTLSDLFSGLERGADTALTGHKGTAVKGSLDRSKVLRAVADIEQTVRNLKTIATKQEKSDKRAVPKPRGKPVRLEIDWNAMPFRMFKQMVDAQDLMNPFVLNLSRIVLSAQILSGALEAAVPVVADEG